MDQDRQQVARYWGRVLDPEQLRARLIFAGMFLCAYEMMIASLVDQVRDFLVYGWDAEKGPIVDEDYTATVLPRSKFKLHASCLWLKDMKALDGADIDRIHDIRRHQRQLEAALPEHDGAVDNYLQSLATAPHATPPALPVDTLTALLIRNGLEAFRRHDTLSFPFDRPRLHAYDQLRHVGQALAILRDSQRPSKQQRRLLKRLCKPFETLEHDRELANAAHQLHARITCFEQLRQALRFAPPACPEGVNHPGVGPETPITTVEAEVQTFRDNLDISDPVLLKLREQLERHWDGLFRAPLTVTDADGRTRVIHPQRTNNILEHAFRDSNHDHCRRAGNQLSAARFDAVLADSVLVRNLADPDYMNLLRDGAADLPERFSRIDRQTARQTLATQRDTDLLFTKPRNARKVLQQPETPIIVARGILEHDLKQLQQRASNA